MGSLVKGLSAVGLNVELECTGSVKDPGWLRSVDRWVVDYVEEGGFNLNALRSQDMVRFTVRDTSSISRLEEGLKSLPMFPGTKTIRLSGDTVLQQEVFEIARRYQRTRIYQV